MIKTTHNTRIDLPVTKHFMRNIIDKFRAMTGGNVGELIFSGFYKLVQINDSIIVMYCVSVRNIHNGHRYLLMLENIKEDNSFTLATIVFLERNRRTDLRTQIMEPYIPWHVVTLMGDQANDRNIIDPIMEAGCIAINSNQLFHTSVKNHGNLETKYVVDLPDLSLDKLAKSSKIFWGVIKEFDNSQPCVMLDSYYCAQSALVEALGDAKDKTPRLEFGVYLAAPIEMAVRVGDIVLLTHNASHQQSLLFSAKCGKMNHDKSGMRNFHTIGLRRMKSQKH